MISGAPASQRKMDEDSQLFLRLIKLASCYYLRNLKTDHTNTCLLSQRRSPAPERPHMFTTRQHQHHRHRSDQIASSPLRQLQFHSRLFGLCLQPFAPLTTGTPFCLHPSSIQPIQNTALGYKHVLRVPKLSDASCCTQFAEWSRHNNHRARWGTPLLCWPATKYLRLGHPPKVSIQPWYPSCEVCVALQPSTLRFRENNMTSAFHAGVTGYLRKWNHP